MTHVWRGMDLPTLDREYNARASVPSFDAELARYQAASAAARASLPHEPALVYDPASGNALDWFAGAPGGPVLLWVHGGYWRALSRADNSCAAPGLVAQGCHVAVIDYSLAPAVTLDTIVDQVRAACRWAQAAAPARGADPSRLFVGGSSAGGHLAAMMAAAPPVPIAGVLALSGLFELEPIRLSHVNAWLDLDAEAVRRLSPQRHVPPRPAPPLLAACGALETREFQRQTHAFAEAWAAAGHAAEVRIEPGRNHFDLVLALAEAGHPLCEAACAFMRGPIPHATEA